MGKKNKLLLLRASFCVSMCHFCHIFPFLFLYVISLQLQGIQNQTKPNQKNNPPFYFFKLKLLFFKLNITIKASVELPFCHCSDNSQKWQVKGKIQEKRICSFFYAPHQEKKKVLELLLCYLVNNDNQHRTDFYLKKYHRIGIFCWIKFCCRFL